MFPADMLVCTLRAPLVVRHDTSTHISPEKISRGSMYITFGIDKLICIHIQDKDGAMWGCRRNSQELELWKIAVDLFSKKNGRFPLFFFLSGKATIF